MAKKAKFAVSLIFFLSVAVYSLINFKWLRFYPLTDWQNITLLVLAAVAAMVILSLAMEFIIAFPFKQYKRRHEKEWADKHSVYVEDNLPMELQGISESISGILDDVEEKVGALKEVKKLDELKYEFITIAYHQLRTPIAEIIWALDFMKDAAAVKADPKLSEAVAQAGRSIKNAADMSSQLLSVVEMLANEKQKSGGAVDLQELIHQAVRSSENIATDRNVKIRVEASGGIIPVVAGDKELGYVFNNLITNALYYGSSGKPVVVRLDRSAEGVAVSVENDGVPIYPEEKAMLFDKFFRGAEAKRLRPDGSGLSLYISKKIVERVGGQIKYDAPSEGRTVFTVVLPIASAGELQKFITSY